MNIRVQIIHTFLLLSVSLASTAGAIEFSILGPDSVTVNPGETFTIDIALDNAAAASTNTVVGTVTGLAAAGAVVTGGQSAIGHFFAVCPSEVSCLDGLNTYDNAFYNPNNLALNGAYTPGDDLIVIVNAITFTAVANTGAVDPGLDGAFYEPSARDVTLSLIANTVGVHVFTVGGTYGAGVNQPITDIATFTVTVVPEPGTALLMGLGLFAFAAAGSTISMASPISK